MRPAFGKASLALGIADHLEVEFLLGAKRCEASPALGMVDHQVMGFESVSPSRVEPGLSR